MARGRVGRSCGHARADVRDTGAIGGRVAADIGAGVACGTRVIGMHTHALRACAHTRIYARAHTYARVRVRPQRAHRGRGEYPVYY